MLLTKAILWSILYPALVLVYATHTLFMWIKFLFNSPVDVWVMISESLEKEFNQQ